MVGAPLGLVAVAFVVGAAAATWSAPPTPVWIAWGTAALSCAVAVSLGRLLAATAALLAAVACAGALRAATPPLPGHHLAAVPGLSAGELHGRIVTEPVRR